MFFFIISVTFAAFVGRVYLSFPAANTIDTALVSCILDQCKAVFYNIACYKTPIWAKLSTKGIYNVSPFFYLATQLKKSTLAPLSDIVYLSRNALNYIAHNLIPSYMSDIVTAPYIVQYLILCSVVLSL